MSPVMFVAFTAAIFIIIFYANTEEKKMLARRLDESFARTKTLNSNFVSSNLPGQNVVTPLFCKHKLPHLSISVFICMQQSYLFIKCILVISLVRISRPAAAADVDPAACYYGILDALIMDGDFVRVCSHKQTRPASQEAEIVLLELDMVAGVYSSAC